MNEKAVEKYIEANEGKGRRGSRQRKRNKYREIPPARHFLQGKKPGKSDLTHFLVSAK